MTSSDAATGTPEFTVWWALFYCATLFSVVSQAVTIGAMLLWGFRGCTRLCQWRAVRPVTNDVVAAVIPCYLPNEAGIIRETLMHLLHNVTHVEHLDVHLVYNTPHAMLDAELDLEDLACEPHPHGRRLFVHKAEESRSKADNLNAVIPDLQVKYVAIYDADHHPDPSSLAMAINHLEDNDVDCVQGSIYIRQGGMPLPRWINAEFFVCYFVILPVVEQLTGLAFFGGSNGIWRAEALQLQHLEFDHRVLTEDIDFSVRSMLRHGLRFAFLPECRSGELAPAGLQAFWRQRLRWAMGWDEVTLAQMREFWSTTRLSVRQRLGLYYIFVFRWFSQLCTVTVVLFSAASSLHSAATDSTEFGSRAPRCITDLREISGRLTVCLITFTFLQACVHEPSFSLILGLVTYFALLPVNMLFNFSVLVVSLVRVISGNTGGWVVTKRDCSYVSGGGERSSRSIQPLPLVEMPDFADGLKASDSRLSSESDSSDSGNNCKGATPSTRTPSPTASVCDEEDGPCVYMPPAYRPGGLLLTRNSRELSVESSKSFWDSSKVPLF